MINLAQSLFFDDYCIGKELLTTKNGRPRESLEKYSTKNFSFDYWGNYLKERQSGLARICNYGMNATRGYFFSHIRGLGADRQSFG